MLAKRLGSMVLVLASLAMPVCGQENRQEPVDILIRGGKIVDGTGNPWFEGDVAIRGDRIEVVGPLPGGDPTRAAHDRRPRTDRRAGFHRHALALGPDAPGGRQRSEQESARGSRPRFWARTRPPDRPRGNGIRDPGHTAAPPVPGRRSGGYFDALERQGIAVNVASYVGLGTLLECVLGDSLGRPDAAQLETMKQLLDEAMRDGALGLSTMLASPRELAVTTDDLVALCQVVNQHGGIYSSHIRNEGVGVSEAVKEAIDVGRRADVPVDIIHLKIADQSLWGRMHDVVALDRRKRARGRQRAGQCLSLHARQQRSGQHHPAVGTRGRQGPVDRPAQGPIAPRPPEARDPIGPPRLVQPLHGRRRRLGPHAGQRPAQSR